MMAHGLNFWRATGRAVAAGMLLALGCGKLPVVQAAPVEDSLADQLERGRQVYVKNCFICHQISGQGVPGSYPPLAKSDFLLADKERAIRIACEGLGGEIVVNGTKYDGNMAAVVLNDEEVADVLTFVRNSWGSAGGQIAAAEVAPVRAKTAYPTFEAMQKALTYPPLPAPPAGFTVREVARMPANMVRLASNGEGKVLYALSQNGDVYRVKVATGEIRQLLRAKRYLEHRPDDIGGPVFILAMTMDKERRLYIASNQLNGEHRPIQNVVTIYRSTAVNSDGDPDEMKPWIQTSYPGSPEYMHCVENMAFGPDGYLYVGNGARTDGGRGTTDTNYFQGGETPMTACMWRFDPRAPKSEPEIYARGLRNPYGFCWNEKGEMFATEHGPDADAPEELNLIEKGKHYGFPYTFSNWGARKAYEFTPEPPAGLVFTPPIVNRGPAGGFYDGRPMYTFDPHSAPSGMVWLGADFPEGWRGTLVLTRFGNFIRTPRDNVGYDVLQAKLQKNAQGVYEAEMHTVLAPLGRPIDIHQSGPGHLYIAEFSRGTNNAASYSPSGRIIELAVKAAGK